MNSSQINLAEVVRALLSILMLALGAAVAVMGSHMSAPLVVVAGVTVVVLGARFLRPISHDVLRWLDGKGV